MVDTQSASLGRMEKIVVTVISCVMPHCYGYLSEKDSELAICDLSLLPWAEELWRVLAHA